MDEHGWRVDDATGSEHELRALLYALVRMLKPSLVVETGCYRGWATEALGIACRENDQGRVVACDTNQACVEEATRLTMMLPVDVYNCRGAELPELRTADFVFCDSGYADRMGEVVLCKAGAVVLVHDTELSYDSSVAPLKGPVRAMGGLCFPSHRGWALLVVPGRC